MTSSSTVPLCAMRRLEHRGELLLVAGERAADECCAHLDGQRADIDGRQVVDDAGLELGPDVGGRGELALGEAVHAVVLDDVNHGNIAAQQVHELANADGGRVAIAADADGAHGLVGQHRAGGHRGHASVHGVEAEGARHEVGRRFGGAADAAHLHHALGLDAHLVEGFEDALGDGVVSAAGAERCLAAAVVEDLEADAIGLVGLGVTGVVAMITCLLLLGRRWREVTVRASMGRPLKCSTERSLVSLRRIEVDLQQAQQLRVAILLDHVNALVPGDEVLHFLGERIGADAQIVGRDLDSRSS